MIKIIKNGETPKTYIKKYQVTCKHCGTIMECLETDLHWRMVGHGDSDNCIVCPVCGRELWQKYGNNCEYTIIGREEAVL